MFYGNIAMLKFLIAKAGYGRPKIAFIIIQTVGLIRVMFTDHFFDGDGTGHGRPWPHSGGDSAKRKTGSTPNRV